MKTRTAGSHMGMKVVVTRSREGNLDLARKLEAFGFRVVAIETMSILPPEDWSAIDDSLSNLESFDWLVFTSAVGADLFVERMRGLLRTIPWDGKPLVAAVGEKTSDALRNEGIPVEFVPSKYLTSALAEELPRTGGRSVLMLRADIADPEAVTTLARNGFSVKEHAIYRTVLPGAPPAADARVGLEQTSDLADADAIIFASPSSVKGFVATQSPTSLVSLKSRGVLAACIGPVTAKAAEENGFDHVLVSSTHTLDGLIKELRNAGG